MKIPIYKNIGNYIMERISSGEFKEGDMIPSEEEFCKLFHTTRMTVRRAIEELAFKGMLHSIKGKGTFVSNMQLKGTMNQVCGWKKVMEQEGHQTHFEILKRGYEKPCRECKKQLHLKTGDLVYVIEKVRYIDQDPVIIEKICLRPDVISDLESYDFKHQSIFHLLTSEAKLSIQQVYQKINATTVEGVYAKLLFHKREGMCLLMENTAYDQQMNPVDYTACYINGDKFPLRYIMNY